MTAYADTAEIRIEERGEQPYLAVARSGATLDDFRNAVDSGFGALFANLGARGIAPAGPPFIRYVVYAGDGGPFEIEIGVPVAGDATGDAAVDRAALPAGRYAVLHHVGAYFATTPRWEGRDLAAAHAALEAWAAREGVAWDTWEAAAGTAHRARVERYLVGPMEEADPERWETELAVLIRRAPSSTSP